MTIKKNREIKSGLISAKEIAKKYNLSYQTLNYYTNLGLLEVRAKKGNMRLYEGTAIKDRLTKISQLISEGYPLRLIRKKIILKRVK